MAAALTLAARGLGRVAPNPAVGCVLAKDGVPVARGWTQPGGRPHAEIEALARAGTAASGATAYVSLEPCAHHGATPPCADALVQAGVARVVVACTDPDPRVAGAGIQALRAAGLRVDVGLMEAESLALNRGFFLRVEAARPLVTLKLASTLDGRIATVTGESQWITGPAARARAHLLRARHDAVLVGSGTATADDPALTVRLPGMDGRDPVRVLLDGRMATPLTHKLIAQAGATPTWLYTRDDNPKDRPAALRAAGVEVIGVASDEEGVLDLKAVLKDLAARGITRLLVEGGGRAAASFLRSGAVDRLAWFRAGGVIGGDGLAAVAALGLQRLADMPRFSLESVERLGPDLLESWVRSA